MGEGGSQPVICEGAARVVPRPWPEAVVQIFKAKYDWDITTDGDYDTLIEITPSTCGVIGWLHRVSRKFHGVARSFFIFLSVRSMFRECALRSA